MNIQEQIENLFKEIFGTNLSLQELQTLSYKQTPVWDSMVQMNLISRIEEEFEIFIPFEEMMEIQDYSTAIKYIESKL